MQSLRRLPSRLRRSLSEYRFYAYLAPLGPGIIAASSGNEVSGIATYSTDDDADVANFATSVNPHLIRDAMQQNWIFYVMADTLRPGRK